MEKLKELIESIGDSLEKSLRTDFSSEIRARVCSDIERYLEKIAWRR